MRLDDGGEFRRFLVPGSNGIVLGRGACERWLHEDLLDVREPNKTKDLSKVGALGIVVFSAGARTPIRSRMSIRLEVEDYISRAQVFQTMATTSSGRAHHDFLWSVGIMIPLARH